LTYTTNASGVATFNLPRSSVAWIWANSYGLNANGSAGVAVTVPAAASANLEELAAFSSVLTTLGDLAYGGASGVFTRLAGNTSATVKFLCQQGNGTTSTAPGWCIFTGTPVTYDASTKTMTISGTGGGGTVTATYYYNSGASYLRTTDIAYIASDATTAAQAVNLGDTSGIAVEVFKTDTTTNTVTVTYGAATLVLRYTGSWAKFIPNGSTWVLWSVDPTSGGVGAEDGYVYVSSSTYSVVDGAGYVDCDATSNAITITAGTPGATALEVRKSDTSTNACTINYNATSLTLTNAGAWAKFVPNSSSWVLLSRTQ
jgi:hypothetical protein